MGMVYAAYDDKLDRKVAIKVLLADELPDERHRVRFLREAQALARLSHPNVVTVHEVGESEGQLFLTMEYIHGQSLARWLRTKPDWPRVIEVFLQAGRGLIAAHRAGLVHRDLKPANIMRGNNGTVKVLDFGLALAIAEATDDGVGLATASGSHSALHSSVTQTGVTIGTPAYMAPEQFTGGAADTRSDQYSFCLTLWEGLTGRRPFRASTYDELLPARLAGAPSWPQRAPAVPRRITEALQRGLSPAPEDRWPSMDALLGALSRSPRRRRTGLILACSSAGVLALGGLALRGTSPAQQQERCTGAHDQLVGVWDDDRRAAVQAAIVGIGRPHAQGVWQRVGDELNAYAREWETMHTETCEATSVRGEQSPRVMDLRMGCLQRAAADLGAIAATLADADAAVVDKAHELTAALRPLSWCEDIEALEATVEPPSPEEASTVSTARQHLARAKSLRTAGRHEAATAAVTDAADSLQGVGYEPVNTELMLERGRVHESLLEYDEAKDALLQALALASQWGQRELAAQAAARLLHVVGCRQQHAEASALLEPLALGLAHSDPTAEIRARSAIVCTQYVQGEYDAAEAGSRRLLALCEATPDIDPTLVAIQRNQLHVILKAQGRYEEAEAEARAVLALQQEALGPDHPDVAVARGNLGDILGAQGKMAQSEAELSRARTSAERALGSEHPMVAVLHSQLGALFYFQGKYEAAEAELRATLESDLRTFGPDHPTVAMDRDHLGGSLYAQGRIEEAETEHRAAVASLIAAHGPDHPDVAYSRSNFALVLEHQGKLDEAVAQATAAVTLLDETLGREHPDTATARKSLARMLRTQGNHEEADAVIGDTSPP